MEFFKLLRANIYCFHIITTPWRSYKKPVARSSEQSAHIWKDEASENFTLQGLISPGGCQDELEVQQMDVVVILNTVRLPMHTLLLGVRK